MNATRTNDKIHVNAPPTSCLRSKMRMELDRFATTLRNDRERDIWNERLLAEDTTTLAQLGTRYGVSKERIRQVEQRLKSRLRSWLMDHMEDEVRQALAA